MQSVSPPHSVSTVDSDSGIIAIGQKSAVKANYIKPSIHYLNVSDLISETCAEKQNTKEIQKYTNTQNTKNLAPVVWGIRIQPTFALLRVVRGN